MIYVGFQLRKTPLPRGFHDGALGFLGEKKKISTHGGQAGAAAWLLCTLQGCFLACSGLILGGKGSGWEG